MAESSIGVGDRAPDFTLAAANRRVGEVPATFRLADLLQRGPAILEFLRGTW